MLKKLTAFLGGVSVPQPRAVAGDDRQAAAAAVLVEAAMADGTLDGAERQTMHTILTGRFAMSAAEAAAAIDSAITANAQSIHLLRTTQAVKEAFGPEDRIALVEDVWQVVYADGHLDAYEASLMRRLGGLLYVTDRDMGAARLRVLERLGLADRAD